MNRIYKRLVIALFALCTLQGLGAAAPYGPGDGEHPCPNRIATPVPPRVEVGGGYKTCGIGITLFGVGGAIVGVRCPRFEFQFPAFSRCAGEQGEGMRCVPDGHEPVMMRECDCGGLMIPVLNTGIPLLCKCDSWMNAGQIESFKTVPC